ncbi:ABC transporter permease [Anoxynatronum buryatiense]|uniref:ABC transport system permease protein n=1 Tax=Anoxynatronum buryatiense TaxID=489973 RepID=A0AA45WXC7_9CLOT|nr:FtsX-like permease family protein [Anoxynatronum buryatiense]SMP63373.1 putative ABC transport system permease protein [Anoxynatronum buryatiense]
MNWIIIKNDFKRNKVIHAGLLLFIIFSASLAVLSVMVATQTLTGISNLYRIAQPPHFLQMHKGELDQGAIDAFMAGQENVIDWQTVTMLNVYGDHLTIAGTREAFTLADLRLDIGLVRQNETRDLLLDAAHEKVVLGEGEVGIPVLLREMYGIEIGDRLMLSNGDVMQELVIVTFVLDSQMNSPMTSSTRILLSDHDFETLSMGVSEHEYLIEAYLNDPKEASGLKTAYENAGLPQNGPTITYAMIFVLSALTDLVTVFVMLLVSLLLIMVAFICIRFTILATLEEEIVEIGIMKAIGLSFKDQRNLYLHKYRLLAVAGVLAGYGFAFSISGFFTRHISTTFGKTTLSVSVITLSLATACLLYLLIVLYAKKILKRIRRLTVVEALVSGKGFGKEKRFEKQGLHRSRKLSVNWLLALREVYHHFRDWTILFAVVMTAVLMMLIPTHLMNTFESPAFITYMGSSLKDILIEVESGEHLETGYTKVREVLDGDPAIASYDAFRRVRVQTIDGDHQPFNIDIDVGPHAGSGLQYLTGQQPETAYEIALSYLNANEMRKAPGDTVIIFLHGEAREFIVSGVYQDVTSGGFTAKSTDVFPELASTKYAFSVSLKDGVHPESKADEWSAIIGTGVKVDPMDQYISQTLGGVVSQLRLMVIAIAIMSICLVMLLTALFMKLRLAKDVWEIAIFKAVGFSEKDIQKQYLIKMGGVALLGIVTGIMLTHVLGSRIINGALRVAGIGIRQVELIANPLVTYLMCPLLLLALVLVVTGISAGSAKRHSIISMMTQ